MLEFSIHKISANCKGPKRYVFNYKRANYDLIKTKIQESNLSGLIQESIDVNVAWSKWHSTIMDIMNKCIPKVCVKELQSAPWFDNEVKHSRNLKLTALRKAKRTNVSSDWRKYKTLRNKHNILLGEKHDAFIVNLGSSVKQNPKRFWSFVKSKTCNRSVPNIISWDDRQAKSSSEQAKLFNEYFHSVFPEPCDNNVSPVRIETETVLSNICISEDTVLKLMKDLDVNKATGPDNLSSTFLKECRNELSNSLCMLLNKSFSEGVFPSEWKRANVVPVFKSKDRQDVRNYRPVSLLSVVSKLAERCVYNSVYSVVCNKLSSAQHGFLSGKSTTTQLVQYVDSLLESLENCNQSDVIYIDFAKAFDSVPHNLLINKLKCYGITGKLLNWMESYLNNRIQRVVINGSTSQWLPVKAGVPQGSILGPLMFLLYINDLPKVVENSSIAMYADDAKIFIESKSINDCLKLQNDIDAVSHWCKVNQMNFNVSKCKVLTVCRKENPYLFEYKINDVILDSVNEIKDLGIIIEDKLSWHNNVNDIISKANRVMGLIKRTVGYEVDEKVKLQLYISLVRSKLEYCTQVWGGMTKSDNLKIERIQRSATRYILNFPDLNYKERLCKLNLLPLTYRRDFCDIAFFHRCMYQNILNVNDFVDFTNNNIRDTRSVDDSTKICTPFCRTQANKNSYFKRIVSMWNIVPSDLRAVSDLNVFKRSLSNYFYTLLETKFDTDNYCTMHLVCLCFKHNL